MTWPIMLLGMAVTAPAIGANFAEIVVIRDGPLVGSEARGTALDRHGMHIERVRADRAEAEAQRWRNRPDVTEAYEAVTFEAVHTPSDPGWSLQWESMQVRMDEAWDRSRGEAIVVIAVLDTGLDPTVADFAGKVAPGGHDYVNNDGNPADDDPSRHGTQVAMVAASNADDASNNAGACPGCRVLPMKVLDSSGAGSDAHVAAAIMDAVDLGAEIINMSLAGPGSSPALDQAIAYAAANGVILIGAAGNEGSALPTWPSAADEVIGVAGVRLPDESDCGIGGGGSYPIAGSEPKCSFSNFGSWVSVSASGCNITYAEAGEGGVPFCGTSSASPMVAGAAGLLQSMCPDMTAATIRAHLEATTLDIVPDILGQPVAEHGRISPPALVSPATALACSDAGFVIRAFSFTRTVLTSSSGSSCTQKSCTNFRLQLREGLSHGGAIGHPFVVIGYGEGVLPRKGPRFTNPGGAYLPDSVAVRDDALRKVAKSGGHCEVLPGIDLADVAPGLASMNAFRTASPVDPSPGTADNQLFFKHGLKAVDDGAEPGSESAAHLLAVSGRWIDDGDNVPEAGEIECLSSITTSVVNVQG